MPTAAPAARPSVINRAAIDILRDLDETGSMELVRQLVGSFAQAAGGNLVRLTTALAQGDAKTLVQVAHALKSSAANIGAEALSACYRELE